MTPTSSRSAMRSASSTHTSASAAAAASGCGGTPEAEGTSPLHAACQEGRLECARLLVAADAAVDLRNDDGTTPARDATEAKIEAVAQQARILDSAQELGRHLDTVATVQTGDGAEGFADDGRGFLLVGFPAIGEIAADIAAPATGEGFLLVAEVAQDGVVAAGAVLAPAHQFQEEIPLVLDHRLFGRAAIGIAFDQPPPQRHIAGGDQ